MSADPQPSTYKDWCLENRDTTCVAESLGERGPSKEFLNKTHRADVERVLAAGGPLEDDGFVPVDDYIKSRPSPPPRKKRDWNLERALRRQRKFESRQAAREAREQAPPANQAPPTTTTTHQQLPLPSRPAFPPPAPQEQTRPVAPQAYPVWHPAGQHQAHGVAAQQQARPAPPAPFHGHQQAYPAHHQHRGPWGTARQPQRPGFAGQGHHTYPTRRYQGPFPPGYQAQPARPYEHRQGYPPCHNRGAPPPAQGPTFPGNQQGSYPTYQNGGIMAAEKGDLMEFTDEDEAAGLDDQDLFFTDTTGTALLPAGDVRSDEDEADSEVVISENMTSRKAAWYDSDDERISVSLASVPRLRKLRLTEDEDVVSGKVYIKRLRKQYNLLNPVPDWAMEALQQPPQKRRRRRLSAASNASDSSSDDNDENISTAPLAALLRSNASFTTSASTKKHLFPPTTLPIVRQPDLQPVHPAPVTQLHHHPTLPLLLSASPAGLLHLHHLQPTPDPETTNPLLTSLHLRSVALTTATYIPSTPSILLSARRPYYHIWNLSTGLVQKITRFYLPGGPKQRTTERILPSPTGDHLALVGADAKRGGQVHILDAKTTHHVASIRIDGGNGVADLAWWSDGSGLVIASQTGEITEWDLDEEEVVGRWEDEGAVGTTVLALGGVGGASYGGDRWVAVGSKSGIVNVYDRDEWRADAAAAVPATSQKEEEEEGREARGVPFPPKTKPKPKRALDQLVTPITQLRFSPDAQLLFMASRWKRDAARVLHLPSCTVYRNWPTASTPLGRITSVAWGELQPPVAAAGRDGGGGAVLGLWVGNEAGKVRAWEIRP